MPLIHEYINPEKAPVLLYLQGGPGDTSLFGLFLENGPFAVTKNQTLKARKYSWHVNHNVIYIDNPVGTGYSYSDDPGYSSNETAIADNLYQAVYQFFVLFPEIRKNEFYVSGESYAGKYVPSLSLAIKTNNEKAKFKINLAGLTIGNGWSDPINQIDYADYLYQIGLVDAHGKEEVEALEKEIKDLIAQEKYVAANSALAKGALKFYQLTGISSIFNYLQGTSESLPDSSSAIMTKSELFAEWVQQPEARKAIHVGNLTFHNDKFKVTRYLVGDIAQSVARIVEQLLEHYRVLIYNGQLDVICAYPMAEAYLRKLNWTGAGDYKTAPRKQYWVAEELAGYSKTVGRLSSVLVRNAGHAAPIAQPRWMFDLITRFTHQKPF